MTAPDIKTTEELKTLARDKAHTMQDQAESDAEALGIDLESGEGNPASESAADDIETASDGALSSDDYLSSRGPESRDTDSGFEATFNENQEALMNEARENFNAFTKKSLEEAVRVLEDVEALLTQIASEAAKVGVAAAAGLLVPPSKDEVRELRSDVATVHDRSEEAVDDLRSARARRDAARRQLGTDPLVPQSQIDIDHAPVANRHLEPMTGIPQKDRQDPTTVNDAYFAASPGAVSLQTQAQTPGRVDARLNESTQAMQDSVLDKVGYIAICMAIAGLDTSQTTKNKAERLFRKLTNIIEVVMGSLEDGFFSGLQDGMQELANNTIQGFADRIQDKLDALDTWLNLNEPQLPTFVSLVQNLGDAASDTPILESLAAHCDLSMASFCDSQGLLEIAKSLDAQLGLFNPRPVPLGRVRLLTIAPEADDYRPVVETLPDQETHMLLVETIVPGSTTVVARVKRRSKLNALTSVYTDISGTLGADVAPGDTTVTVTGLPSNVADRGQVDLGTEVLDYKSHAGGVFTLIDVPEFSHTAGPAVTVTGEQRDNFIGAFEPSPNIRGGAGTMVVLGEGENREELGYSSSTFNAATGHHTFTLSTTPVAVPEHRFQVVSRPHSRPAALLYKASLTAVGPADRFNVSGNEIVHATDPDFNFITNGIADANDYDSGGLYRLKIGNHIHGVRLNAPGCHLSGVNTKLLLHDDFYGGDQIKVPLSRVDAWQPPGASVVRTRLNTRQLDDLSPPANGRVIIDAGTGARRVRGEKATVTGYTTQTLTPAEPIIQGDETDWQLEIQSGPTTINTAVVTADGSTNSLTFNTPVRTGTVQIVTQALTGVGTLFTQELAVGNYIYAVGGACARVESIADDTNAVLALTPGLVDTGPGAAFYLVAPVNADVMTTPAPLAMSFNIYRQPVEIRNFSSATHVIDDIYDLAVAPPTEYAHSLQELEITPTVHIVSESIEGYRTHFQDEAANRVSRFDGKTVPPGVRTVRAELETPEGEGIYEPFVLGASELLIKSGGTRVDIASVVEDGAATYIFTLNEDLPAPLSDGEVVEVETTSIFDQLQIAFPDDWAEPFDNFFSELGRLLTELDRKICRMLGGRPMDVAMTASAISALVAGMALVVATIKLTLQAMILGMETSVVLEGALSAFEQSGMDAAAEATRRGDVATLSQMTSATSTSEGQARESIQNYKPEVILLEDAKIADSAAAAVTSSELDKEILATSRRPHKDIVKEKLTQRVQASMRLAESVEQIT